MSEPLRVALVVTEPERRGAQVFAYGLAGALEKNGHEAAIIYLYDGPSELPLRRQDRNLRGQRSSFLERVPGFHPGLLARLAGVIRALDPDVVQLNGSRTVKYGALCRAMSPRSRWALIYRNIGDPSLWVHGAVRSSLYRRAIVPRMDGIVSVSEASRRGVAETYRYSGPHVHLPRAVDLEAFVARDSRARMRASLGAGPDDPVLLFVGRLSREKRPDRLARLYTRLREGGCEAVLWVAGEGPDRSALVALEKRFGSSQVRLLGVRDDVASLMAAADVLVLTSDTEGMPGVVVEAGAAGLPVVATDVGGVRECVEDDRTGLLVAPEDEAALCAAARSLFDDSARRSRMGAAARRRVEERFALASVAIRYASFYREVLSLRRTS